MGFYKIRALHDKVTRDLAEVGGNYVNRQQEAWWLLEALTSKGKTALLAEGVLGLSQSQELLLDTWVTQRVKEKKPLQYILGLVPFCDLELVIKPPVLIPRVETEEMTMWLIHELEQKAISNLSVLDLCTGSGCIGLALAKAFPTFRVVAIDSSDDAIALATENKKRNAIENIEIIKSDLYSALSQDDNFDLIVSNPPYLSEESFAFISPEVKLWEDYKALVGGSDGMLMYERIVEQAPYYLKKKGAGLTQLIMEIGIDQENIEDFLVEKGFTDIRIMYDMAGMRRWVIASI